MTSQHPRAFYGTFLDHTRRSLYLIRTILLHAYNRLLWIIFWSSLSIQHTFPNSDSNNYLFQRTSNKNCATELPLVGSLTRHLFVIDPEAARRPGTVRVESDRHRRRVTDEIVQVVAVTVRADSFA